jgi:hypothetical protein
MSDREKKFIDRVAASHIKHHPSHEVQFTLIPYGWICKGTDTEACGSTVQLTEENDDTT